MYSRVAALQSSRVISRVEGKKRGGVAELQLAAPSVGFCPPLPVGGRRQLLLLPVAVEVPVRPPLPVGGRRQLLLLPGAE